MKLSFKSFIIVSFMLLLSSSLVQAQEGAGYWNITSPRSIQWNLNDSQHLPHQDNIEMAGKRVASIVTYSVDTSGMLTLNRQVFFPQLHPFIKDTAPGWHIYRAYLKADHGDDILPKIFVADKRFVPGPLKAVKIDGMLNFEHKASSQGLSMSRRLFPSPSERLFVEHITLTNTTKTTLNLEIGKVLSQSEDRGADGMFITTVTSDAPQSVELKADETFTFSVRIMAQMEGENLPDQTSEAAMAERQDFLNTMAESLVLETPNATLNTLFEFSKIRGSESIFESKLGLIHSPGGGRYYVGIWANDQAEYINPYFPFLGYDVGNESAMSTYRAFAGELNDQYKPLRYAFEIEGNVPPFTLDRGDAAMIAYGASQFALALGDKEIAEELWPLIIWCLEYNKRKLNAEGVVMSESDEMEGRIETGNANLSTSSLYYGALDHTADLAKSLGKGRKVSNQYRKEAQGLVKAIEAYFGANVEGLDTYKYYKEHKYLRHWICLPLVVGINDRKDATIEALFDRLWTENGVHVEKNSDNEAISKIFWDRGTLYALRGTFLSGATNISLEKLEEFSTQRLLGKRVPYVVEAYPEGSMAHLSAESGLYGRVFIEGMFGIKATGLDSFSLLPRLPKGWNEMALRSIKAFGQNFDIEVKGAGAFTHVKVIDNLTGKTLLDTNSSLEKRINFRFK
ncbi:MAG: six-hairpin glycosidase-like protein [Roseivirga sp.]|nr:six-hairpin glycosidase-like protein [Roseivirga sp.]